MSDRVEKNEEEWRASLSPEQFAVCRAKGTESPFSGKYCDTKDTGVYRCVCCNGALFHSDAKFESGSGWPSFYSPVDDESVREEQDQSHGMIRTEVLCSRCDAHLGHVFPDGPRPTGLRYCINSVSLDFQAEGSRED